MDLHILHNLKSKIERVLNNSEWTKEINHNYTQHIYTTYIFDFINYQVGELHVSCDNDDLGVLRNRKSYDLDEFLNTPELWEKETRIKNLNNVISEEDLQLVAKAVNTLNEEFWVDFVNREFVVFIDPDPECPYEFEYDELRRLSFDNFARGIKEFE